MITDKNGTEYLTYREFAERFGYSEACVRQMVHRGNLWCTKFGKKPYIRSDDEPLPKPMGRPTKEFVELRRHMSRNGEEL